MGRRKKLKLWTQGKFGRRINAPGTEKNLSTIIAFLRLMRYSVIALIFLLSRLKFLAQAKTLTSIIKILTL
jgi:hypothetical protein